MNTLSWLIYLAEVLDNTRGMLQFIVLALTCALVLGGICLW